MYFVLGFGTRPESVDVSALGGTAAFATEALEFQWKTKESWLIMQVWKVCYRRIVLIRRQERNGFFSRLGGDDDLGDIQCRQPQL